MIYLNKTEFKEISQTNSQLVYVDSFPQISLSHTHTALLIVEQHFWSQQSELQMYSLVTSYLKRLLISHGTADDDAKNNF